MNSRLEKLTILAATFNACQEFEVGDVVVWKDGLKNKKSPEYNEPVVVTRVYDVALYDTKENTGSVYFNEPLDIAAGLIDSDGDFVEYHFDSRRFQEYSE